MVARGGSGRTLAGQWRAALLVFAATGCAWAQKPPPPPPPPPPCEGYNCGHGTCSGDKVCTCTDGWSGKTCNHPTGCDNHPCQHGGTCTPNGGSHSCACPAGYTGSGDCDPVRCGPFNAPANSQWAGGSCNQEFQGSCAATCVAGWTGGQQTATFTCGADGKYSGSLNCQRISCGPAPTPAHTTGCNGKSLEFQAKCTARCEAGWTGGTPQADFECQADKSFSGSLTCQKVSCGPSPSPPHTTGCGDEKLFQEKCSATCDTGYTAGKKVQEFECKADKTYSGSLECVPVSCGNAPVPGHVVAPGSGCKNMVYPHTCTMTCDDCYSGPAAGTANSLEYACLPTDGDDKNGHFDPGTKEALQCVAVSCGPSPTVPPHATVVQTAPYQPWSGEKTCSEQPANEIRAVCDAGYTSGEFKEKGPTNREATIRCQHDGQYSATLTCVDVPCHRPVLPPANQGNPGRGCPEGDPCRTNVVIPPECDDRQKTFEQTCAIDCAVGFTRSFDGRGQAAPANKTYTCVAADKRTGNAASETGVWDPPAASADEGALRCEAVDCGPLEREPWTYDPNFISSLADLSNVTLHTKDLTQLGTTYRCGGHYKGFGDTPTVEWDENPEKNTPSADGTCLTECLPSWYPKQHPQERQLEWVCSPPSDKGPNGVWKPSDRFRNKESLECEMGRLDVNKSHFSIDADAETTDTKDWNAPLRTVQYPGGSLCQGFPGASHAHGTCFDGYRLAPRAEPTMQFWITAKDSYGQPRNYQTLTKIHEQPADYLLFVLERVPLANLDEENRALQPRLIGDKDCAKSSCQNDALYPLRSYGDIGVLTSLATPLAVSTPGGRGNNWPLWPLTGEGNAGGRPMWVSEGADGLWKIEHSIKEHGVFYVSVYLCELKDGNVPRDCERSTKAAAALVPGTGLDNGPSGLPSSAFTVCPQNTYASDFTAHGVVIGQQLADCKSKVGFYSPKGPGHVAEHCLEGFTCSLPGMRWPVATPGYWVDDSNPSLMSKCVTKGACPGSDQFVPTSSCPTKLSFKNDTAENTDQNKLDWLVNGQAVHPPYNLKYGCFMLAGDAGIAQRAERTGQPFLEKACYLAAGHRCCPGATGPKCSQCCTKDMGVPGASDDRHASCNGRQWHSKGTGEGQHCEECPPTDFNRGWVALVFLMGLMLLPLLMKVSDLMKHAGAVTGPFLSVMNFAQSADLYVSRSTVIWLQIPK